MCRYLLETQQAIPGITNVKGSTCTGKKTIPYSNVFGDYSLPKGVERKIIHLLRKKRLLIGCSSHVTPNHSHYAWSFMDKQNQSAPLVSFSSPVHGDTDQSNLLRADCFSLLGCFIYVDYLCQKFRKRFKAVHILCNNTAAISSATQDFPLSAKTVFMDDGDVKAEHRHFFK